MAASPVETITIPTALYAELLDCQRKLSEMEIRERAFKTASKSPIEHDLGVATFLAERLGRATVKVIRAECLEQFGAARTPSQSAVFRFWDRLRGRRPE